MRQHCGIWRQHLMRETLPTFTSTRTNGHSFASVKHLFIDYRIMHLGLKDLVKAIFADLLTRLGSLDQRPGSLAQLARGRGHGVWCVWVFSTFHDEVSGNIGDRLNRRTTLPSSREPIFGGEHYRVTSDPPSHNSACTWSTSTCRLHEPIPNRIRLRSSTLAHAPTCTSQPKLQRHPSHQRRPTCKPARPRSPSGLIKIPSTLYVKSPHTR